MLMVYYNPFMAYFICHELWLYPKSMIPLMGFMNCMEMNCQNVFLSFMNYGLWVGNLHSGGQGGEVNAPQELEVSSPNLGLSWRHESFALSLGELCSALWSVSWREFWFCVCMLKVCPSFWFCTTCLFVVSVWRFGILLILRCPLFPGYRAFTVWVVGLPGG